MKISVSDRGAVQAALDAAEGRCTARCVSADRVLMVAAAAEERLEPFPKRLRAGTVATFAPGGPGARRYNAGYGGAAGTEITVTRFSNGWALTAVRRVARPNCSPVLFTVRLPAKIETADVLARLLRHAGLSA